MKITTLALCSLAAIALAHPGHENMAAVAFGTATSEVKITVEGAMRVIRANGIPDHPTGEFPVRGNPNSISVQRHEFRTPLTQYARLSRRPLG